MSGFDPAELARLAEAVRRCADQESKADADGELTVYCFAHRDAIVAAVAERDEWRRELIAAADALSPSPSVLVGGRGVAAAATEMRAERDEARAALGRVEALHQLTYRTTSDEVWKTNPHCSCGHGWPCQNTAALRGDKS